MHLYTVGRLEGFRRILKLLFAEDSELTREILKTLKHFLDVQSIEEGLKQDQEDSNKKGGPIPIGISIPTSSLPISLPDIINSNSNRVFSLVFRFFYWQDTWSCIRYYETVCIKSIRNW